MVASSPFGKRLKQNRFMDHNLIKAYTVVPGSTSSQRINALVAPLNIIQD